MVERKRLEGMKEIAYRVAELRGRPFTRSAASHASRLDRPNRLPVNYYDNGDAWAWDDEIVAHVQNGRRRSPRARFAVAA
jgi:hypothetical protein